MGLLKSQEPEEGDDLGIKIRLPPPKSKASFPIGFPSKRGTLKKDRLLGQTDGRAVIRRAHEGVCLHWLKKNMFFPCWF